MQKNTVKRRFISWALVLAVFPGFSCDWFSSDPDGGEGEYAEIDDVLPNPFKGFAPWIGTNHPVYEEKLQYATFGWADIEPVEGTYDWTALERNWGNIARTGKRVGFRIAAVIPGSGKNDTPQWLVGQGVAMRPYSVDGEDGFAPDWDDPKFLEAHHRFIEALGGRYDDDPRVGWIDIGSYGFWGEWHVWLNEGLAATQATKQAILEDYFEAFPTKPKVIAFDDDFATRYVTDRGGGVRNDCLGTDEANDWYVESMNAVDPNLTNTLWKTAIITGEFCGGDEGAEEGTTVRFDLNYDFIRQTHWSFIGPAGGCIIPRDPEHRSRLDLLHKTLGYRFVIRAFDIPSSAARGEAFDFRLEVENVGIAPFCFDWPVKVTFIGEGDTVRFEISPDMDIRMWLPGRHVVEGEVTVPGDIEPGACEVRISIPDSDFPIPGIRFANAGNDDQGRCPLGVIEIE